MNVVKKLTPDQWKMTPWKNGKGKSVQIFIYPQNSTLSAEDFQWRLSLATLEQSAPFSSFPKYDRVLTQLNGGKLQLEDEAAGTKTSIAIFEPYAFDGAKSLGATLTGEKAVDINAMVEKTFGQIKMTHQKLLKAQSTTFSSRADFILIFNVMGSLEAASQTLGTEEALWLQSSKSGEENVLMFKTQTPETHLMITEIFKNSKA